MTFYLFIYFLLQDHQFCVIYSKDRTVIYMFSLNHLIRKRSITKSLLVYLIRLLAHGSVSLCTLTSKIFHKKLKKKSTFEVRWKRAERQQSCDFNLYLFKSMKTRIQAECLLFIYRELHISAAAGNKASSLQVTGWWTLWTLPDTGLLNLKKKIFSFWQK